jgi:hypothetical protein
MSAMRRWAWIIIGVVMALVLVLGAIVSAVWLWKRHQRFAQNGQPCATFCAAGRCVHENDGDRYCAIECDGDRDCPSAFVCDPTLSGRHHVCLKGGAATSGSTRRRSR